MHHNEAAEHERPHKRVRHFGGFPYHLYGERMNKTGAEATARHFRNRGYLVRIVKEKHHNEWVIYRRKV